jgi:hypothetical protein
MENARKIREKYRKIQKYGKPSEYFLILLKNTERDGSKRLETMVRLPVAAALRCLS